MRLTDHNKILHMSWQCYWHEVCKILLWSAKYVMNKSITNFHWISNSIEISFVGWAPDLETHKRRPTLQRFDMSVMASQITATVCSTACSGIHQRKHQSSAILARLWGEPPVTDGFPSQRGSNAENVSMSWPRHDIWPSLLSYWVSIVIISKKIDHVIRGPYFIYLNGELHILGNICLYIIYVCFLCKNSLPCQYVANVCSEGKNIYLFAELFWSKIDFMDNKQIISGRHWPTYSL